MSTTKGSEGIFKIGANTVAELNGWSVDESASTIDDGELKDSSPTFVTDMTSWTGSVECHWDKSDTLGQEVMTVGATVVANFYAEGETTGDRLGTGTAIITGVSSSGGKGSMVSRSFTLQGSGALVWSDV